MLSLWTSFILLSCIDRLNGRKGVQKSKCSKLQTVLTDTPPFSGESVKNSKYGERMQRRDTVSALQVGIPSHIPSGQCIDEHTNKAILKEFGFMDNTNYVKPQCVAGLLSNPLREDGLALDYNYYIIGTDRDDDPTLAKFTGYIPVFTEGNWWPYVGSNEQPQQPYDDYHWHAGLYFVDGNVMNTEKPLLVRGSTGAIIENTTPYSIIITSGSYPGNEYPGQNLQILPAMISSQSQLQSQPPCAQLPTPPIGIVL